MKNRILWRKLRKIGCYMGANYKDDFDLLGLGLIILGFLEKNIGLQRNYYGLRAIYSELCLLNLVKSGENNNKLEKIR